jgi:hypothetical protein
LNKNYISKIGGENTKKAGTIPAFSEKKINGNIHLNGSAMTKKCIFAAYFINIVCLRRGVYGETTTLSAVNQPVAAYCRRHTDRPTPTGVTPSQVGIGKHTA